MTLSMIFPDSKIDDPFWMAGQLIAVCAIGIMIYFGYRMMGAKGKKKK